VTWNGRNDILSFEEITRLVRTFAELGINKVRLTGGEPLLRMSIEKLVKRISKVPGIETIGMTTNGYRLKEMAESLKENGLKLVNVSLDSLKPERFERIAGIRPPGVPAGMRSPLNSDVHKGEGLNRVLSGIESAIEQQFDEVKINTVVIKGFNDDEILDFVEYAKDKDVYLRFIEFMPFFSNGWEDNKFIPNERIKREIERSYKLFPMFDGSNVAVNYMIAGHKARIGFISSNSAPFCRECSRLRLTSDGKLKLCLFEDSDYDLKKLLRRGSDNVIIKAYIRGCMMLKWEGRAAGTGTVGNVMTKMGG
jgi:cyclic pyranopterin phosphate synthase